MKTVGFLFLICLPQHVSVNIGNVDPNAFRLDCFKGGFLLKHALYQCKVMSYFPGLDMEHEQGNMFNIHM